jgi:diaminopimelate epimerase
MKFTKMHGAGNDYITIDAINEKIELTKEEIATLCEPHFGVLADSLVMACPSTKADFKMRMFNADGSEAEMCGNGIRCVSRFAYDKGIIKNKKASVETLAGIKYVEIIDEDVKVNMGKASFSENPLKGEYDLHIVSMGNPHAVMIVDDVYNCNFEKLGAKLETHKAFPNRTNVEFIKVVDKNNAILRVWERGCGETLACGTGTAGAFAVLNKLGLLENKADIKVGGGVLKLEILNNQDLIMQGNARYVYTGEVDIRYLMREKNGRKKLTC